MVNLWDFVSRRWIAALNSSVTHVYEQYIDPLKIELFSSAVIKTDYGYTINRFWSTDTF